MQCSRLPVRHSYTRQIRALAANTAKHSLPQPHHDQATSSSSSSSRAFDDGLQMLIDWREQYGSCYVPRSAVDAAELEQWVSSMRKAAQAGQLTDEHRQQLTSLQFVWKPNVVDAKWHSNYHRLRCWITFEQGDVQQLLQYGSYTAELKAAALTLTALDWDDAIPVAAVHGNNVPLQDAHDAENLQQPAAEDAMEHPRQQPQQQQPQQQQQQQSGSVSVPAELHEVSVWLHRQVVLYCKLKLTPVKVQMLRKIGIKLRRQAGLTKPNLHPLLRGQDPEGFKRRPIMVKPATTKGKRVVAAILRRHKQEQEQQQQHARVQQQQHVDVPAQPLQGTDVSSSSNSKSGNVEGSSSSTASSSNSTSSYTNGSSNSTSGVKQADSDIQFMFRLADLQRWKKKHGTCYIPRDVFDAAELALWVQQVRQQASHAAADDDGNPDDKSSRSSSSRDSSSSSSSSGDGGDGGHTAPVEQLQGLPGAHDTAGAVPSQQAVQEQRQRQQHSQQQQQQQQQQWGQLPTWQVQELDAVGFVWRPKQAAQEWCIMYHQLRQFKQENHHIKVSRPPAAAAGDAAAAGAAASAPQPGQVPPEMAAAAAAAAAVPSGPSSLAAWLAQQDEMYVAGRLSRLQVKQLRALGWKPPADAGSGGGGGDVLG